MKKFLSIILAVVIVVSAVSCAAPSILNVDDGILSNEDVQTLAVAAPETLTASEEAYVLYAKQTTNWNNAGDQANYLHINYGGTERHVLLKFDISKLDISEGCYVSVQVNTPYLHDDDQNNLELLIYKESTSWNSSTVTWASLPFNQNATPVGRGYMTTGDIAVDITDCVLEALANGETTLSLRLALSYKPTHGGTLKFHMINSLYPPQLVITDTTGYYTYDVLADETANAQLWAYAKNVYDSWKARYDEIVSKGDYETPQIDVDKSQYTFQTTAKEYSAGKYYSSTFDTRLVDTLGNFTSDAEIEFDKYGGVISDVRFEATGYFYTKNVDGRWFVIDPLGYPCLINGINHTYHAYSESTYQTAAMAEKFGSEEKWAISTTRWLKNDLGFNVAEGAASLLNVKNGLPTMVYAKALGPYASKVGLNTSTGGTTDFLYDVMPVFDPGFKTYVEENVATAVRQYADNEMVLGFFSDNELPIVDSMLTSYLKLDPSDTRFQYSYVCAWTWLTEFTGKDGSEINFAILDDLSEELGVDLFELFKGFVYDRYYSIVQPVVKAIAPNQLYLGVRILDGENLDEWHSRFNGYWCDITCINYYGVWEISTEHVNNLQKWIGKPFIITEFYAKGNDAIGSDGKLLANTDGAGWICNNQTERGYFYQNFTLRLLEAKNCVGWLYFQYIDNDPLDTSIEAGQSNSNKGIVNSDHDREVYKAYTDQIAQINLNKYALIEYFDGVDYFN